MRNSKAKKLSKAAKATVGEEHGGYVQVEVRDGEGKVYNDRSMVMHNPRSWKAVYKVMKQNPSEFV